MRSARVPTPFEARVYALVRRIPKGQTRSYRWVAEQLGDPNLARAVGNALNRNPCLRPAGFVWRSQTRRGRQAYASHVPCHRVVKSDGSLGGFAHGTRRKRRLLLAEGAAVKQ
jgi:methylated-DNA-[protein]-cysteine S-methyltransferase